jgi:hypothetical protein
MYFGFRRNKKLSNKDESQRKMDLLVKLGRDQFRKLIEKGINVPVALL